MNRYFVFIMVVLFLNGCTIRFNQTDTLPRSTPEAEGVSSQSIINFIEAAEKSNHEFHSIMILRHGKVIAEGWWNPYSPELKHTLYSTSKSFTSTAIGFAVSENRLSLSDKVISFFPKDVPDTISQNLAAMTVKDLLTMSAGQDPEPTFLTVTNDSNWVQSFLAAPVKNKPGTKFLYNTLATYMLSAIIQKVTGEKVIDYLKPRLFEPLNIEGIDWEVDPRGINTGGWGLRLKTEDMAKFGQLYLQKGRWNDIQILPAEWVEEATSFKIDQAPGLPQARKDSSDWMQGYCYQFWRCRHSAYRADGAYGQYIIVMPEHDAVVVITGESPDMQDQINLVWEYILPAFHKRILPENIEAEDKLSEKLASLALPVYPKSKSPGMEDSIRGKVFALNQNELGVDSIRFNPQSKSMELSMSTDKNWHSFAFGSGNWITRETTKHGPYLLAKAKAVFDGLPPFQVAGNYQWTDSATISLKLRYIESPHSQNIICKFKSDSILVQIANSNDFGRRATIMSGVKR
jgi:CubicO group peptidase (beta-lactamase class C family)